MSLLDIPILSGPFVHRQPSTVPTRVTSLRDGIRTEQGPAWTIKVAGPREVGQYARLRRDAFVTDQQLFDGSDADDHDDDQRTIVLVAVATSEGGEVLGGVRLAPVTPRDLGWWAGSRLVVDPGVRGGAGIGADLVRQACATAIDAGALRFEASVQPRYEAMFTRLGWHRWGAITIGGLQHSQMRFPIDRIQQLAARHKAALAALLDPFGAGWDDPASLGGAGFVGDDGAPVPGTDVVAACDAILPGLIERDPEWAGWCGVLVNVNDLAAMGAAPLGLMNAIGARDLSFAKRIMNGLRSGAAAWGVPILGGHTQFGVAPSLTVTALGRAARPVPGGAGRFGDALSLTLDLAGGWRRGSGQTQWDSSSGRSGEELRTLTGIVAAGSPRAAKDVSMTGIIGTIGMLAESSGLGATVDVAAIPTPERATQGDWLTCFPGFGMVTADTPGASRMHAPPSLGSSVATAEVGTLTAARGVQLRWPDGETTTAIPGTVTGLGRA